MGSLQGIDPTAFVALEGATEWTALVELPELLEKIFPARVRFELGERDFVTVNRPATSPPLMVQDSLRENLARQLAVEKPMEFPKRSNRRLKDYIFLVVMGNALVVPVALFLHLNPVTIVYLLAWVVLFNAGVYWIMFQVMDRY